MQECVRGMSPLDSTRSPLTPCRKLSRGGEREDVARRSSGVQRVDALVAGFVAAGTPPNCVRMFVMSAVAVAGS